MSEVHKQRLHDYLSKTREAVVWKAEGLSEYDARRPLTVTGTNLPRPDVTLHAVLVHVLAETARHAGHADILREQLDGRTGLRADNLNQQIHDERWWSDYRAQIESAARSATSA